MPRCLYHFRSRSVSCHRISPVHKHDSALVGITQFWSFSLTAFQEDEGEEEEEKEEEKEEGAEEVEETLCVLTVMNGIDNDDAVGDDELISNYSAGAASIGSWSSHSEMTFEEAVTQGCSAGVSSSC